MRRGAWTVAVAAPLLWACAGGQRPGPAASPAAEAGTPEITGPAPALTGLPGAAPVALGAGARTHFEEGVSREAAGDLQGAAAAFEQAFAADPAAAFAGVNAGVLRERLGDDGAARALYARVLDRTPTFFPAAQNLVRLDARRGHAAEGEAEVRARLEKHPQAVALHNALAEVLLSQGRLDPAEEAARRALKLEEKNVPAMVNLATVYARKKRFELARMVLDNARQVDDRDASVWNRRGFVELSLGDRIQALECFRTAAALRPDYPEAHANYGALLADAEDFGPAAGELETAVRYAPSNALAWMNLGNAYRGLKQFEKAEAAYQKALSLDPKLSDARYNLAILYLDGEKPGLAALPRLQQGVAHLDAFEAAGGVDPRVAAYRKDAARAIEREKKRQEREEKDRLRKEAEARKAAEAPAPQVVPTGSSGAPPAPTARPAGPAPASAAEGAAAKPKKKATVKKQPGGGAAATSGAGAERGDK